jgi:tripartite ATP-independent transporter DctM subunit
MIIATISLVVGVCFLLGGLWVGCALGLTGFTLIATSAGFEPALAAIGRLAWTGSTSFVLIAIPLFVLMGEVADRSGLMQQMFQNGSKVMRGIPGNLLQVIVAASTLFAACTGSSVVAVSTVGKMSYPEMVRMGYKKSTLLGVITAGGTLGPLIPPSIVMIVFADFVGVSVGDLFMAGLIPGLIMAGLFALMIAIWAKFRPGIVGKMSTELTTLKDRLLGVFALWPVFLLILVVLGGIYTGIATPTEVAALGATLAMAIALIQRRLTRNVLREIMLGTVRTTSMIMLIVIGAKLLSVSLAFYNIPPIIRDHVVSSGMSTPNLIMMLVLLYLILGIFFEALSSMIITLPFILNVLVAHDINLVWFGVLLTILVGIGQLTPPVGLNLYVMSEVSGEKVGTVVRGALPFLAVEFVVLVLIVLFPNIVLYIPQLLHSG